MRLRPALLRCIRSGAAVRAIIFARANGEGTEF
jgi:hypothetical protein